jgi:adenylate cyclase, class 2
MHLNIEIKARSRRHDHLRQLLAQQAGSDFRGTDHQVDTYFHVPHGRLKLRQGNIENNLIHYHRPDQAGPKASEVQLYRTPESDTLRTLLGGALGVRVVVDKLRDIYFIDNVKFHLDTVQGLGTFVEIEAIDFDGTIGAERLHQQCEYYLKLLDIAPEDLLDNSYSDMLLNPPHDLPA